MILDYMEKVTWYIQRNDVINYHSKVGTLFFSWSRLGTLFFSWYKCVKVGTLFFSWSYFMHFRLSSFQKIIDNRKLNAAHLIFKLGPSKSWKERGNDNMFLFELKIHHRKCWSNSSKTFFLLLNIVRSSIRDKQNIPFF